MKRADLFGVPVFLNHSGDRFIKTKCGACLSIISTLAIFLVAYCIFDNNILSIYKQDLYSLIEYGFNGNDFIDLNDIPLIGFDIKDEDKNHLSVSVSMISMNITTRDIIASRKIEALIAKCPSHSLSKEQVDYYSLHKMMCIEFINNDSEAKLENRVERNQKNFLSIQINTKGIKATEEEITFIAFDKYKAISYAPKRYRVNLNRLEDNVVSYEIKRHFYHLDHFPHNSALNLFKADSRQSIQSLFCTSKLKLLKHPHLSPLMNKENLPFSVTIQISLSPDYIRYQIPTPSLLSTITAIIAFAYLITNIFRCIALSNNINAFFYKIGNGVFNYDYKLHITSDNALANNSMSTLNTKSNQSKPISPLHSLNANPIKSSTRQNNTSLQSNAVSTPSLAAKSQRSPLALSTCEWLAILFCTNSMKFDKKRKSYLFNKTKAKVLFFSDFSNLIKALIDIRVIKKKILSNQPLVTADFSEHYNIGIFDNNLFGQSKQSSSSLNKSFNDSSSFNDYSLTNTSYFRKLTKA